MMQRHRVEVFRALLNSPRRSPIVTRIRLRMGRDNGYVLLRAVITAGYVPLLHRQSKWNKLKPWTLVVGDCGAYILLLSAKLNHQSGHSSNFSPSQQILLMSVNTTHEFPSPVGGVPLPFDFDPAILFSIIHALLIPIALWRIVHSRSRTFVLIGTVLYIVER